MNNLSKLLSLLSLTAACYSLSANAIIVEDIDAEIQSLSHHYSAPLVQQTTAEQLQGEVALSQSKAKPELHDYEDILATSNIFSVELSPDGQWLSYFEKSGVDNRRVVSLWVYNIKHQKARKLFTTKRLQEALWTADSQSLFLETGKNIAVIDLKENSAPHVLFQKDRRSHEGILFVDYIHRDSVLVTRWDKKTKHYQVIRYNSQGDSEIIYQTDKRFMKFGINHLGQPAFVMRPNEAQDNKGERLIFDISGDKEKLIWQCDWLDKCGVLYFDNVAQLLWVKSNTDSDFSRLVQVDVKSGKLTALHSDPLNRADHHNAVFEFDEKQRTLKAPLISYRGDYKTYYAADKRLQSHLDAIENKLATKSFDISTAIAADITKQPWLVVDHDNQRSSVIYYLYQPQTGAFTRPLQQVIAKANTDKKLLPAAEIAKKFAINYRSRDGFLINGYLTLPLGVDISKAPMVTNVHGGPWSRVDESYKRSTQILANRGYIVFEPNFRSSTGFGKTYLASTAGEHGDGRIQQDIIDGVHFLLKHNIGDKDRMAVTGHSFGAYSVLAALAFNPELFQVGFAGAAPHDIGRSAKLYYRFAKQTNKPARQYFMKKLVVDWDDKKAMAEHYQRSPAANAGKITKPLVMWAGKNDRRVFIADIKNYALTVEEMDKKVSLFVDPKALHSPGSRLGMFAYQYLLEKTLSDNIGGAIKPIDPIEDKKLYRFLKKNMAIDHNDLLK
ncbi:prolyl oligopeptidase family serine peptidase [Psychrobium sp. MM17-31]|uniref:alpha/beta hydrolase family protein n=1 Tax=Psychrobium sp. MM17-31 TaxID=2917758 RepID=UPI001EF6841F|nr:prolyl oligopeptidase family serine peptidase [Psychrobium sp. MM17-31]MCG7532866.1 prolyl oligopeptidase family serine peptidase [Psychrobium sp. MM17-31]